MTPASVRAILIRLSDASSSSMYALALSDVSEALAALDAAEPVDVRAAVEAGVREALPILLAAPRDSDVQIVTDRALARLGSQ